jgi:hypothetical protein
LVPSRIVNNHEKLPHHTAKPAVCHSIQWKNQYRIKQVTTHGAKHALRPFREPGHFPPDHRFFRFIKSGTRCHYIINQQHGPIDDAVTLALWHGKRAC